MKNTHFLTVITYHIFKKYSLIFSKVFWSEISFSSTALYHFTFKNYHWSQSYQWVKICKHQVKWKYLNIEIIYSIALMTIKNYCMCLYVFQKRLRRTSATIFKDIISGAAKVTQRKSTVCGRLWQSLWFSLRRILFPLFLLRVIYLIPLDWQ